MIDLQDVMDSIKYDCPFDEDNSIIIIDMLINDLGIEVTYKKGGLKKHHKKERREKLFPVL